MNATIPTYIQGAWALYNNTEALLTDLWEFYQDDFMEYYFPEISDTLEGPEEAVPDHLDDEDDLPF